MQIEYNTINRIDEKWIESTSMAEKWTSKIKITVIVERELLVNETVDRREEKKWTKRLENTRRENKITGE